MENRTRRIANPFTPGKPINKPEDFVGRSSEVDTIVDALFQTVNGNAVHLMLTGDRGIGKTSLLNQVLSIAKGDNSLPEKLNLNPTDPFNFLVAHFPVDTTETPSGLVRSLSKELKSNWEKIIGKYTIKADLTLFQIEKKDEDNESVSALTESFIDFLKAHSIEAKRKGKSGILILIDELDRVSSQQRFGTFFKRLADGLSQNHIENIIIIGSGITGTLPELAKEHPSVERSFQGIRLNLMTELECKEVLEEGFNKCNLRVSHDVLSQIFNKSAGYPEIIQLMGYTCVDISKGRDINDDVFTKAVEKIITGSKKDIYYGKLKEAGFGQAQQVLKVMAESSQNEVRISHISKCIGKKTQAVGPVVAGLMRKGLIKRVTEGVYVFSDPLLKEYIKQFGVLERKERDS